MTSKTKTNVEQATRTFIQSVLFETIPDVDLLANLLQIKLNIVTQISFCRQNK